MKVAKYYKNDDVRIEEMPIPEINDDELLVKVEASGICGSDVMEWYRIKKAPLVLGHEISGVVEKTGKNVKKFKEGDRVFVTHHVPCNTCRFCLNDEHTICKTLHSTNFYPGGFSQFLRVPSINVDRGTFLLPEEIDFEEGTFIEPLACVVRGFRKAGFEPSKTMLVMGSGIAGLLNIKLAKAYGATRVFATDINDFRLQSAEELGADVSIHAEEDVSKIVKQNNDGRLADFVVVCAGVKSAIRQAIECVEPGGTILWFAPTKPGVDVSFPFFKVWNKQIKMCSTYAGAPKDILESIDLLKSKKIRVKDMITHRLPMDKTPEGFKLVNQAEESIKVVIKPNK
ncbi:MAG: alcohol dehydrogenase catalytic domain-containing protein [Candidatus Thermoplasmatota archaeon]